MAKPQLFLLLRVEREIPEPQKLLYELNGMSFNVNLWEHGFVNSFAPFHDAIAPYSVDYLVWEGLVPDFSLPEAREIFSSYHKGLVAEGVSSFKLDVCDCSDYTGGWSFPDCASFPSGMDGEQYHHLLGTLYAQTMLKALGEKRSMCQVRSLGSFAASYPFFLTSDLYDFGDFLMGAVNAGFSGLLWVSELRHAENKNDLLRRLQLASLSPLCLVNAWYLENMPWQELDCENEVREILENRMRLIPYIYAAYYDYHTCGKPVTRALVCDYPDTRDVCDEFLVGDMIAAPLAPGQSERTVYLPEGEWYDFFTNEKYEGGKHTVKTEGIPLYVKAGTIIPVAEPCQHIDLNGEIGITLRCFGNCDKASCRLVADDGESRNAEYQGTDGLS